MAREFPELRIPKLVDALLRVYCKPPRRRCLGTFIAINPNPLHLGLLSVRTREGRLGPAPVPLEVGNSPGR
jgi:hypothetical protein